MTAAATADQYAKENANENNDSQIKQSSESGLDAHGQVNSVQGTLQNANSNNLSIIGQEGHYVSSIGSTDVIQSSRQSTNTTIMSVISQMSNSFIGD